MVNVNDKVPRVPGVLVNENVPFLENVLEPLPWTYSHVGQKLELNDKHSKHLNQEKSAPWTTHNLEVYLHLVDGFGRYETKLSIFTWIDLVLGSLTKVQFQCISFCISKSQLEKINLQLKL